MIINGTDREVESTDEFVSTEFSLDTDSLALLFKGFSDSLYSNKIGSIVREITSNCFDSHVEAGVDRDVEIEIFREALSSDYSIIFRDFGVGLSPDRIKNVYSRYFASTKRNSNDVIGGFGIGCKTPLSYTDIFTVRTVFDGTEYTYAVHRGAKVPELKEIERKDTDRCNGTEVIIGIKNHYDLQKFKEEIRKQLMYFEGITYINCDVPNDYKIYAGKNFLYRPDTTAHEYIHAVIGRVAYPLDLSLLGQFYSSSRTPVAVKFDVGEISVTMNRESIEYTDKTIALINERIGAAYAELQEIYDRSLEETDNLYEVIATNANKNTVELAPGIFLKSDRIKQRRRIYTPFKDHPELGRNGTWASWSAGDLFDNYIEVQGFIGKDGKLTKTHTSATKLLASNAPVRRVRDSLGKRKSIYIAETFGNFYAVRMKSDWAVTSMSASQEAKKLLRKEVLKAVLERSKSYDEEQIPQEWMDKYLEELKAKSGLLKDKTVVPVKFLNSTYDGIYYRMGEMTYNAVNHWCAQGGIFVYSTYNSESLAKLHQAAAVIMFNRGIMEEYNYSTYIPAKPKKGEAAILVKVSEPVAKNLSRIPGTTSAEEFLTNYGKLTQRTVTGIKLEKVKFRLSKLYKSKILSLIHGGNELYETVDRYYSKRFRSASYTYQKLIEPLVQENKENLDLVTATGTGKLIEIHNSSLRLIEKFKHLNLVNYMEPSGTLEEITLYKKQLREYLTFKKILTKSDYE